MKREINMDEFLYLAKRYVEEQYHTDEDVGEYLPDDLEGILSEAQERKERMERRSYQMQEAILNLSDADEEAIEHALASAKNFKVGDFVIKIKKYRVDQNKNIFLAMDIYEEKLKITHFGSNKMPERVNILKDCRFQDCTWIVHFKYMANQDIPIKTGIQIIRWLQAVGRLPAYI